MPNLTYQQIENALAKNMLDEAVVNPTVKTVMIRLANVFSEKIISHIETQLKLCNSPSDLPISIQKTLRELAMNHSAAYRQRRALLADTFKNVNEIIQSKPNILLLINTVKATLQKSDIQSVDEMAKVIKLMGDLALCYMDYLEELHSIHFKKFSDGISPTPEEYDSRIFQSDIGKPMFAVTLGIERNIHIDIDTEKGFTAGKAVFAGVDMPGKLKFYHEKFHNLVMALDVIDKMSEDNLRLGTEIISLKPLHEAVIPLIQMDFLSEHQKSADLSLDEQQSLIASIGSLVEKFNATIDKIQEPYSEFVLDALQTFLSTLKDVVSPYLNLTSKLISYNLFPTKIKTEDKQTSVDFTRHITTFEKLTRDLPLIAGISRTTARLVITLFDMQAFNQTSDGKFNFDEFQMFFDCLLGFLIHDGHHSMSEVGEIKNRAIDLLLESPDNIPSPIQKYFDSIWAEQPYQNWPVWKELPYTHYGPEYWQSFLHPSYRHSIHQKAGLQEEPIVDNNQMLTQ